MIIGANQPPVPMSGLCVTWLFLNLPRRDSMRAIKILKVEGLASGALKEAYMRVRAALGGKVEGGHVPEWGPEDGGAWLTTKKYQVALSYYHPRPDLKKKSLLEMFYSGEIPDEDLKRVSDTLRSPPLPSDK